MDICTLRPQPATPEPYSEVAAWGVSQLVLEWGAPQLGGRTHSPAAALGAVALGGDGCHFPDADAGLPSPLLIVLDQGGEGQGGSAQSGCGNSSAYCLEPGEQSAGTKAGSGWLPGRSAAPAFGLCPAAQVGMLSSSPLPSLTCPSTPGGPTLLVPGPDCDPQGGASGTHLPDPNHWAASRTSCVLMHELKPPGLPTDLRLGPLLLLSWPWQGLSGPGSRTFLPRPLG